MTVHHEKLPVAALEQIDALCAAFENAWQLGERPDIESLLTQIEMFGEASALLSCSRRVR